MRIAADALDAVKAHAKEGYPHEICGFLIGRRGSRRVARALRTPNIIVDRPHDRYKIDDREMIRVQRETDNAGEDILGIYHSHPDHPARASIFDDEQSWAGWVYLIVSCVKGKVVDANAFVAREDHGHLFDEPLEIG